MAWEGRNGTLNAADESDPRALLEGFFRSRAASARLGQRRSPRLGVRGPARLRVGDLTLDGAARDAAAGGVFFGADLLVEVGERGVLETSHPDGVVRVPVRVAWVRGPSHPGGSGMGLAFDLAEPAAEDQAARLLLALLLPHASA